MRATTIRRLIVFGVCALGVGSLYLVPSMAGSPDQLDLPPLSDEPTGNPPEGPAGRGRQAAPTGSDRAARRPDVGPSDASTSPRPAQPTFADKQRQTRERRASPGATAYDPSDGRDNEAPEPVRAVDSAAVSADRLAVTWSAATDNVGVVGYRIWLNGFQVASTAETHAELRWFNDDATQHVVQVRALDAAGNQSMSSPTFVVTRPTPAPTPAPTPTPTDSPEPGPPTGQPSDPATSGGAEATTAGSEASVETQ